MKKWIYRTVTIMTATIPLNCTIAEAQTIEYKDTYLSTYQKKLCKLYGNQYSISPQLLMALIETESSGRMDATNGSCYGICQINAQTWGDTYNTEALQVEKACQILTYHLEDEPDISYALGKYNGDSSSYRLYMQGRMTPYAKKVLNRTWEIEDAQGLHDY